MTVCELNLYLRVYKIEKDCRHAGQLQLISRDY